MAMILQNFVLPKFGVCTKQELYCHLDGAYIDFEQEVIVLHKGGKAVFDTYFNSFFGDRWKKYTTVKSLAVELRGRGRGIVRIFRKSQDGVSEMIFHKTVELRPKAAQRLNLFQTAIELFGILYVEYEALADTVFGGGVIRYRSGTGTGSVIRTGDYNLPAGTVCQTQSDTA